MADTDAGNERDELVGTQLGPYRIVERLARGGMGVVYRAEHTRLRHMRALKVIAPEVSADPTYRQRFELEAQSAAAIEHPNVVPIHDYAEHAGRVYIAMRLVAGDDLSTVIKRDGALAPQRAALVIAQAAAALDAAHARGLVHRDVKPANILVEPRAGRDHVWVTDFGLARAAAATRSGLTGAGKMVGTIDFIAPEQAADEEIDGRADVYALGGVLYFTLAGIVPYPRDSDGAKLHAHMTAPPPRFGDPQLARRFGPIVERAMAKRREDRFASAGDVGKAVLAAVQASPGSAGVAIGGGVAAASALDGPTAAQGADLHKAGTDDGTEVLTRPGRRPEHTPPTRHVVPAGPVGSSPPGTPPPPPGTPRPPTPIAPRRPRPGPPPAQPAAPATAAGRGRGWKIALVAALALLLLAGAATGALAATGTWPFAGEPPSYDEGFNRDGTRCSDDPANDLVACDDDFMTRRPPEPPPPPDPPPAQPPPPPVYDQGYNPDGEACSDDPANTLVSCDDDFTTTPPDTTETYDQGYNSDGEACSDDPDSDLVTCDADFTTTPPDTPETPDEGYNPDGKPCSDDLGNSLPACEEGFTTTPPDSPQTYDEGINPDGETCSDDPANSLPTCEEGFRRFGE